MMKKYRYLNKCVNIRTVNTNFLSKLLSKLLNINRHMERFEYAEKLGRAKLVVNTHSPMQIVSTRYFETAAAGSIIVTPPNPALNQIFSRKIWLEFNSVDDFNEKIQNFFEEPAIFGDLAKIGYEEFSRFHTWDNRAESFVNILVSGGA